MSTSTQQPIRVSAIGAGAQAARIAQAREVLKPSPVEPGIPNWFRLALLRRFGPSGYGISGRGALAWARKKHERRWGWIDHHGKTTWQGRLCFVAEPYSLSGDDLAAIQQLAADLDCEWTISPNSWHFPGYTFRVLLWQREVGK